MDQDKNCRNCGECYDERGHGETRYFCVLSGEGVDPDSCDCGGGWFTEKREADKGVQIE